MKGDCSMNGLGNRTSEKKDGVEILTRLCSISFRNGVIAGVTATAIGAFIGGALIIFKQRMVKKGIKYSLSERES